MQQLCYPEFNLYLFVRRGEVKMAMTIRVDTNYRCGIHNYFKFSQHDLSHDGLKEA